MKKNHPSKLSEGKGGVYSEESCERGVAEKNADSLTFWWELERGRSLKAGETSGR